jgi:hypothetical protein
MFTKCSECTTPMRCRRYGYCQDKARALTPHLGVPLSLTADEHRAIAARDPGPAASVGRKP